MQNESCDLPTAATADQSQSFLGRPTVPREKPSTQILTADGAGGMRAVSDHRFDAGAWPVEFIVPGHEATQWMAHLHAECETRGWQSGGLSQVDAAESSGSLSLHSAPGAAPPTIEITWDKARDKALRVRARTGGNPAAPVHLAREFLSAVDERLRRNTTLRVHRRAYLKYEVLPWRGELWLGCDLRLGPPSPGRRWRRWASAACSPRPS